MKQMASNLEKSLDRLRPHFGEAPAGKGEELFSLSEKSMQAMFENAPDAIVIISGQRVILRANGETERLFRYGRQELAGEKREVLIPEWLRRTHKQQRACYSITPEFRPMSRSPNMVEIPLATSANRLQTRDGVVVFVIMHDMTEWVDAHNLEREANLERTLAELSGKFVSPRAERVDGEVRTGLQLIADTSGADRATIALSQQTGEVVPLTPGPRWDPLNTRGRQCKRFPGR